MRPSHRARVVTCRSETVPPTPAQLVTRSDDDGDERTLGEDEGPAWDHPRLADEAEGLQVAFVEIVVLQNSRNDLALEGTAASE